MDADVGLPGPRQVAPVGVTLRLPVYPELTEKMGLDMAAELEDGDPPLLAGLHGLVGSLALEVVNKGFVDGLSFMVCKLWRKSSTMAHNPLLPRDSQVLFSTFFNLFFGNALDVVFSMDSPGLISPPGFPL